MKKLEFNISINATAKKVWQVLWFNETYRKWTSAFAEGSYAESDWKEGSAIRFLIANGDGMYSIIDKLIPDVQMTFKHLGEIKNGVETNAAWAGSLEEYFLSEETGVTALKVLLDSTENFETYFVNTFPKALALVKELSENPVAITIQATVDAPVEKVWQYWTAPEHIMQWNNASDDWHTPAATNDLRIGGSFIFTMAAKDGSFSFDFGGQYTNVKTNETIAYTIADGRKVKIDFSTEGNQTKLVETFDAEEENTLELQQSGWQAILNNFKKHTEGN